ncbi:DNA translocase FtsK [Thiomicrospira sp.]|uniref:DNA translocase FtsK n=1 Tax=Thiomicrospira sp. TaxID=935 RepID=UPI0025DA6453|nr:DNA translocase FtsK [Thiomicrospira sp.]
MKSANKDNNLDDAGAIKPSSRWNWLLKDLVLLSCIGLAFFLFIILYSYHPDDPGFQMASSVDAFNNYGGASGAWLSSLILYLFGVFGFAWPFGILLAGWVTLKIRSATEFDWVRFGLSMLGLLILVFSGASMASLYLHPDSWVVSLPYYSGGVLGYELSLWLVQGVDLLAATLFFLVMFALGFSMLIGQSWLTICDVTGRQTWRLMSYIHKKAKKHVVHSEQFKNVLSRLDLKKETQSLPNSQTVKPVVEQRADMSARIEEKRAKLFDSFSKPAETQMPIEASSTPFEQVQQPASNATGAASNVQVHAPHKSDSSAYVPEAQHAELPSLDLLDPAPVYEDSYSEDDLKLMSGLLETRLQEFGVTATVEAVLPGPVVTRFEIMPAAGVKVSQISNLAKDLARALAVKSVRVVDIIPGKPFVGIEIPNEKREIVGFRDILSSEIFQKSKSPLTMGLGKDIAGNPVIADLAKMPHLLVAGTTGSGKSVGVNSMILSLLYKSRADEVRLIMVDPKMLELSVYEDIPHLLTPVVTDMSDAANALRWCVFEMDRRYQLMAKLGVRNIAGFNEKVQAAMDAGEPIIDPLYQQAVTIGMELSDAPPTLTPLPYIVVVIDEFADMIMVVGKKVEELIARLAQKARASGIHLILATQRPSVNVITGLIKANIPTRMSFQVSSKIDSRTILDQMGAEQLLGMGDMLYLPPGTAAPDRVHGAFVSDDEVHRVVDFIKQQGAPQYLAAITRDPDSVNAESGSNAADPSDAEQDVIYDEAVEFVVQAGRVSISSVQRRFKIGYNRAARIVEAMEAAGVVSTMQSNGNREVLVPKHD